MNQRTPDGKEVRDFLGKFLELYSTYRHGAQYLIRRPKDPVLVKQLLTFYAPERLVELARELLTTKEDWVSRTDRGIGILLVKASWLDGVLCERAAQQKKQQTAYNPLWMRECLALHGSECENWKAHQVRMAQAKAV